MKKESSKEESEAGEPNIPYTEKWDNRGSKGWRREESGDAEDAGGVRILCPDASTTTTPEAATTSARKGPRVIPDRELGDTLVIGRFT